MNASAEAEYMLSNYFKWLRRQVIVDFRFYTL